jgi:hypothetical protein|tara:strand:+ start:2036 stop:4231 length:2196 start_codon:yes stop_codon:yes gene_type:complete
MGFQVSPGVNVSEIDLTGIIPAVSTTEGALAGWFRWGPAEERNLISSEEELVSTFGEPDSTNFNTFFTAANFLSYGNKLFVARAIPTDAINSTVLQNQSTVANNQVATQTDLIKNSEHHDGLTLSSTASLASFIAKYPGSLGNSLKVSVCDSALAFEDTFTGVTNSSMDVNGSNNGVTATMAVGSNTLILSQSGSESGDSASQTGNVIRIGANLAMTTAQTVFTVGDTVRLGNSTIGYQHAKIVAKSAVQAGGNHDSGTTTFTANVSFTLDQKYRLSTAMSSNSTVGDSINSGGVTRFWEFKDNVDKAPGQSEWSNNVANNTANDELHIVVTDEDGLITGVKDNILEVWEGLSRASDAKNESGESIFWKDVIDNQSNWLWVGGAELRATSNVNTAAQTYSNTGANLNNHVKAVTPFTSSFQVGSDGTNPNETSIAIGQLASAVDLFKNPADVDVSLILTGLSRGGTNGEQWPNYLIDNISDQRKDCVVFLSPEKADVVNNQGGESNDVKTFADSMSPSSYAVMDSGWKYQYDKYNDVYRYVPLNGDIAGLCVRTDDTRDPWFSPAGYNRGVIKNVIKLPYNPDKADRDILYKNKVNPVITQPGQGTLLFGDKTLLAKPSAFDRINVRRLFIVLEKAIATAAKYTLFEFNDEFTRAQFRNMVEPFLRDVQGRRGIFDFRVVCDETNNTGEVIDSNRFVGDIYIKPARAINFIQLNFVAVRTGVEFSEVVGSF